MRRPITLVFASFMGGIFLGYNLGLWMAMAVMTVLSLPAYILVETRDKSFAIIIFAIAIFGASYIGVLEKQPRPFINCEGQVIDVEGKVIAIEDKQTYLRLILKCRQWEWEDNYNKGNEKVIVNLSLPAHEASEYNYIKDYQNELIGSDVSLKGRLSLPSSARNPGLFNYRLYLKTKGIYAIISANQSNLEIVKNGDYFIAAPWKFKMKFASTMEQYMDPEAKALLMGILFGDKTMIDEDVYESFQRNGCAHILSVSGLHVGIIYIYMGKMFRNRRSVVSTILALSLLLFYAALAGFSPSVLRAVTMIALHIISKHLHRRYDLLCCVSFSAVIMLILNPYWLFNMGFQLSYLAVLSLSFGLPLARRLINKVEDKYDSGCLRVIMKTIAPIFVIQGVMAPITAYHFLYISFSSFFINIPIIAISSVLVPAGVGMALLCLIWDTSPILGPGTIIIQYMLQIMIKLNALAVELPLSSMNTKAPSSFLLVIFYGGFFLLTSESLRILRQLRKKATILLIIASILIMSIFAPIITGENFGKAEIVFVDVGQGDCIHIRTPKGKNILIDGGGSIDYDVGKKILRPYLLKNGVGKVDLALVTHLHQDHYGGLASLCNIMEVKKMVVYEGNMLKEKKLMEDTGLKEENFLYAGLGDRLIIEEDIYIDILYPEKQTKETYETIMAEGEDENLSSLVMRVSYRDVHVLVTGDMGFLGEEMLMNMPREKDKSPLKSHILKVGHHGSRFSTGVDFLDETEPQIAIIQVGKNNYGHPHPDVIEKLEEKGIMIFRNDEDGAILLDIKPEGLRIRTMLRHQSQE